MAELARVNRVNKASLCRRMIYQMLQKVDEAAILEWRESGARVADKHETDTGHIRDDKRSITGSSYGNDLTATGERAFRITGSFVDRSAFGCDDGFDSTIRKTLPAHYPGHALERGFQCEF